ncbi:MAG: rhodanese-like domain-containing protein [bacterium]
MSFFGMFGQSPRSAGPIGEISVNEAHGRLSSGDTILIDVRAPNEWHQGGRPKGSHGVTLQDPQFLTKVEEITGGNKETPIALICRSGARSMQAAALLARDGYNNVDNVKGGFMAWAGLQHPVDYPPFNN